ncbi:unnamed protein product [Amoebophrya sp. A25]|nr:unnamed protein product [Amoebophrya sp. A25]|eukprot:GSA25T00000736001.1
MKSLIDDNKKRSLTPACAALLLIVDALQQAHPVSGKKSLKNDNPKVQNLLRRGIPKGRLQQKQHEPSMQQHEDSTFLYNNYTAVGAGRGDNLDRVPEELVMPTTKTSEDNFSAVLSSTRTTLDHVQHDSSSTSSSRVSSTTSSTSSSSTPPRRSRLRYGNMRSSLALKKGHEHDDEEQSIREQGQRESRKTMIEAWTEWKDLIWKGTAAALRHGAEFVLTPSVYFGSHLRNRNDTSILKNAGTSTALRGAAVYTSERPTSSSASSRKSPTYSTSSDTIVGLDTEASPHKNKTTADAIRQQVHCGSSWSRYVSPLHALEGECASTASQVDAISSANSSMNGSTDNSTNYCSTDNSTNYSSANSSTSSATKSKAALSSYEEQVHLADDVEDDVVTGFFTSSSRDHGRTENYLLSDPDPDLRTTFKNISAAFVREVVDEEVGREGGNTTEGGNSSSGNTHLLTDDELGMLSEGEQALEDGAPNNHDISESSRIRRNATGTKLDQVALEIEMETSSSNATSSSSFAVPGRPVHMAARKDDGNENTTNRILLVEVAALESSTANEYEMHPLVGAPQVAASYSSPAASGCGSTGAFGQQHDEFSTSSSTSERNATTSLFRLCVGDVVPEEEHAATTASNTTVPLTRLPGDGDAVKTSSDSTAVSSSSSDDVATSFAGGWSTSSVGDCWSSTFLAPSAVARSTTFLQIESPSDEDSSSTEIGGTDDSSDLLCGCDIVTATPSEDDHSTKELRAGAPERPAAMERRGKKAATKHGSNGGQLGSGNIAGGAKATPLAKAAASAKSKKQSADEQEQEQHKQRELQDQQKQQERQQQERRQHQEQQRLEQEQARAAEEARVAEEQRVAAAAALAQAQEQQRLRLEQEQAQMAEDQKAAAAAALAREQEQERLELERQQEEQQRLEELKRQRQEEKRRELERQQELLAQEQQQQQQELHRQHELQRQLAQLNCEPAHNCIAGDGVTDVGRSVCTKDSRYGTEVRQALPPGATCSDITSGFLVRSKFLENDQATLQKLSKVDENEECCMEKRKKKQKTKQEKQESESELDDVRDDPNGWNIEAKKGRLPKNEPDTNWQG